MWTVPFAFGRRGNSDTGIVKPFEKTLKQIKFWNCNCNDKSIFWLWICDTGRQTKKPKERRQKREREKERSNLIYHIKTRQIRQKRSEKIQISDTHILIVAGHHFSVWDLIANAISRLARIEVPVLIRVRIRRIHSEKIGRRGRNAADKIWK